jgi:hypothetical protein
MPGSVKVQPQTELHLGMHPTQVQLPTFAQFLLAALFILEHTHSVSTVVFTWKPIQGQELQTAE